MMERDRDSAGRQATRKLLSEFLKSMKIDNYAKEDDTARIGGMTWVAREYGCGLVGCDGWEMVPVARPGAKRSQMAGSLSLP